MVCDIPYMIQIDPKTDTYILHFSMCIMKRVEVLVEAKVTSKFKSVLSNNKYFQFHYKPNEQKMKYEVKVKTWSCYKNFCIFFFAYICININA